MIFLLVILLYTFCDVMYWWIENGERNERVDSSPLLEDISKIIPTLLIFEDWQKVQQSGKWNDLYVLYEIYSHAIFRTCAAASQRVSLHNITLLDVLLIIPVNEKRWLLSVRWSLMRIIFSWILFLHCIIQIVSIKLHVITYCCALQTLFIEQQQQIALYA